MDDTRLSYSVTSLASEVVRTRIQEVKQHFSSFIQQSKIQEENFILKNVAHITLKSLFYLTDPQYEQTIREKLRQITFPPIPITAEDLAVFVSPKFGNVLVAKVQKTDVLQQLHEDILTVIDPYETHEMTPHEREGYNPHVSILYSVPQERIHEAIDYAREHILPIHYTMQSFHFMKDVVGVNKERAVVEEYFAKQ